MKRWIKRTLIGLLSTSVLLGGLAAYAGNRMHGGMMSAMSDEDFGRMRAHMVERAGKELNLDDAQKQRLAALADKLREQRNALVGANADARKNPRAEMQALVAGPKFDRAQAQNLIDAKTNAIRSKGPDVITAAADFYDSLNPTQQQKVREFMNRRGQHHGERHGRS